MEKLFFNQYEFLSSYYPGRIWANPENKRVAYDPRRAAQLLANAGYKTRNAEGILLGPDGKPFEVTLEFGDQSFERVLTVIREDFEAAGIRIRLRRIDPRTLYRKVSEREFSVTYQSWGAIIFPNPESSWMSALADASHNNNLPGFKNRRVDRLCEQYNVCFDQDQRVEIIRQIDGLIFREHPYALGWYSPMTRILYWDRFGHPERYFSRVGDERNILTLWWANPEKEARLRELRRTGAAMPQGRVDVAPWEDWGPQTLPPDEG